MYSRWRAPPPFWRSNNLSWTSSTFRPPWSTRPLNPCSKTTASMSIPTTPTTPSSPQHTLRTLVPPCMPKISFNPTNTISSVNSAAVKTPLTKCGAPTYSSLYYHPWHHHLPKSILAWPARSLKRRRSNRVRGKMLNWTIYFWWTVSQTRIITTSYIHLGGVSLYRTTLIHRCLNHSWHPFQIN